MMGMGMPDVENGAQHRLTWQSLAFKNGYDHKA